MLGVGVIGLGVMGQIHAQNLLALSSSVTITAVYDTNAKAMSRLVISSGARPAIDALDVVVDPSVDAVVVAHPAHLHAELIAACVAAKKAVFCEKPVATTISQYQALRALADSDAADLIWVGFMRRFDPSFVDLRDRYRAGDIGSAVFLDMAHRNPGVPSTFGNDAYMAETLIHEFDVTRWILGEDISSIQVDSMGPVPEGMVLNDPQFVTLRTVSGVQARIAGHITNGYGYDIRCEIVGDQGALSLDSRLWRVTTAAPPGDHLAASWTDRFQIAYRQILTDWLSDLNKARHTGVRLADGLAASAVALAGYEAICHPGQPIDVGHES
jgi:myo-inositol 2-dehydrogenase/D-chiro-inositol 1-dehydrogenase